MRRLLFLFLILSPSLSSYAIISLPDIIGGGMVLQRNQSVPVWGMASPGEKVSLTFSGQKHEVVADASGRWMVWLSAMPASSEPRTMEITGTNRLELENILVGEVWLCTGQSNMQWTLRQSAGGEEAIAQADFPEIRLFNVSRSVAFGREKGKLATWKVCSPESVPDFSGAGYFFGLELYRSLKVPVGLINSSYGGSQAEAWTPVEYLAASDDLRPCIEREKIWEAERPQVKEKFERDIKEWEQAAELARAKGEDVPRRLRVPDALRDYRIAASIYNTMIEPLIPFAIKGAIWYQGESNEERAEQYELLLPTMIRSWREKWEQGDFPFGIIQLPNFRDHASEPEDQAWSHIREAQRRTSANTPHTGLIVTIDLGEADDIHPTNKLDVGKRMSSWALAEVYGRNLTGSGPVFSGIRIKSKKVVVLFDKVGKGLEICEGKELTEFVVAGEDGKWHWAKAKISGRDKVIVWSEKVRKPIAVRYAFNNNPEQPNLSNDSCIPASPFRSDNWPGPTAGKR